MDHYPSLHGRSARAALPHHGPRQHLRHVQGHGHPRPQLHPLQGVPGGAAYGAGPRGLPQQAEAQVYQTQAGLAHSEEEEQAGRGCEETFTGEHINSQLFKMKY